MIETNHNEKHPNEDEIDDIPEESFPASDPPAWTLGIEEPHPPDDAKDHRGPTPAAGVDEKTGDD